MVSLAFSLARGPVYSADPPSSILVETASETEHTAALPDVRSGGKFVLQEDDVVAFVGGADVASALHTGHLEALLSAKFSDLGVRFRNFGWEGDTVYEQPRDVGFPPLTEHLTRSRVTQIVLQFGKSEAFSGAAGLAKFIAAYHEVVESFSKITPRLVLVTPPPFENAGGLLPDLSTRNSDLEQYAVVIRAVAQQRGLPLIDLFAEFGGKSHRGLQLTQEGLQLTPRGQALVARAFVRQAGFGAVADAAGEPLPGGAWPNESLENLRQAVVSKNRLWFDYWRPQNWAFLGGDRTNQPSSRDHRDPSVRWFPEEMRMFVPLIEASEAEIAELASKVAL